ncbi:hypothetical protein [Flexithrix dorotheae]|nr:hypothetical protein [Flexithrix dorotheae]
MRLKGAIVWDKYMETDKGVFLLNTDTVVYENVYISKPELHR